jgi:hypothetical protein
MKPESQLRAKAMTGQLLAEMAPHQLQKACAPSKKLLADVLNEQNNLLQN